MIPPLATNWGPSDPGNWSPSDPGGLRPPSDPGGLRPPSDPGGLRPPSVQSISAANLADGQSIAFDNGNLTVTRQDSMFIIKENNGDQMWLLDSKNKRYVAVRDTDRDGDYDSLVESWGDPHFNTEKNLSDITDAQSLARHINNATLKNEYDVQTDYSLRDSEGVLAMTTKGNDHVVLNDEGTMSYRGSDGQWSEFSFKFGENGVTLTDDARHSVRELSATGKPLTNLAMNPNAGSDDLFVISETGQWNRLALGSLVGTDGHLASGGIEDPGGNAMFNAQADFEDRIRNRVEDRIENRVEDRIENRVEDRVENRVGPIRMQGSANQSGQSGSDSAETDRVSRDFAVQQVLSRVRSREMDREEDDESDDRSPTNPVVKNTITKARDLPPVDPTAAIVASQTT
jgi:hypothetical protein